jgi:hypothetical protein
MRWHKPIVALVISSMAMFALHAQQANPQLQALDDALPGNLINDPSKLDWPIFGPGVASKPIKDPAIPGGGGAIQISSPKKSANIYDIGANAPVSTAIKPGQKIVVAFYARTISADTPDGKAKIGLRIQQNAEPYPGFGDTVIDLGSGWQLYEATATSNIAIAKGLAVVNFQLSGAKQTVQIGQTIIVEGVDSIKYAASKNPPDVGATLLMPKLDGKGTLINTPENLQSWAFYGADMTHKPVVAKSMPGGSAIAVNIAKPGLNAYDAGVNIPFAEAVSEGDVMTVAFVARTISAETDAGAGKIALRIQHNVAPYSGFGDNVVNIGPNWKVYQLRTQARLDIPKGEGAVALQFAGAKQLMEIGPVYVLNAGPPAAQN